MGWTRKVDGEVILTLNAHWKVPFIYIGKEFDLELVDKVVLGWNKEKEWLAFMPVNESNANVAVSLSAYGLGGRAISAARLCKDFGLTHKYQADSYILDFDYIYFPLVKVDGSEISDKKIKELHHRYNRGEGIEELAEDTRLGIDGVIKNLKKRDAYFRKEDKKYLRMIK